MTNDDKLALYRSNYPKCRYCGLEIIGDKVPARGYWGSVKGQWSHHECLDGGFKEEAFLCQSIDADCNDCLHFEAHTNKRDVRYGKCNRVNRPEVSGVYLVLLNNWPQVMARPNSCTGYPCFVHRLVKKESTCPNN